MNIRKILIAVVLSIPLLPFIILKPDALEGPITFKDMVIAAPFVLEFLVFYCIYKIFSDYNRKFTAQEQKLLLILAVSLFLMIAIPILSMLIIKPLPDYSTLTFLVLVIYAAFNLIISVKRIAHSSGRINSYFLRRYIFPSIIAFLASIFLLIYPGIALNGVTGYFIAKNLLEVFPEKSD